MGLKSYSTSGFIVYRFRNKVNGKIYIGQTRNSLSYRIRQHKKSFCVIGSALRKYGLDNFSITYMPVKDLDEANQIEEFMIGYCKSHVDQHGYNVELGGNNQTGGKGRFRHSPESKAKLSKAHKEGKYLCREVLCIETGIIYESTREAYKSVTGKDGCNHIPEVCRGKRKKAYGYSWRYTNGVT